MKKVLVTRSDFSSSAIERLQKKFELIICDCSPDKQKATFIDKIKGVDAVFCTMYDFIDKDVLDAAGPQLKVISTASIHYDHIDMEYCKKRNIIVTNVFPIGCDIIAELAIGLILTVGRRIFEASMALRRNRSIHNESLQYYCGKRIKNSVIGIVGIDVTSVEIIKRLVPFNVSAIYYNNGQVRNKEVEEAGIVYSPFEELLQKSDFVIASCTFNKETKELFNAKAFDLMNNDGIFINIGRPEVVQYDDLYDALRNGKIRGAGLDIMHPEVLSMKHMLFSLSNLVLTPNLSFNETSTQINRAERNAQNIISVLEEGKALDPIN